ncbi:hypothetical protein [Streptomyces sp. NPDC060002]|uniref:hypothetical protein n=1 Tax=Streptomyces sp. NPDC060002 TaxID=3347033 RepID=UPI0036B3AEB3
MNDRYQSAAWFVAGFRSTLCIGAVASVMVLLLSNGYSGHPHARAEKLGPARADVSGPSATDSR